MENGAPVGFGNALATTLPAQTPSSKPVAVEAWRIRTRDHVQQSFPTGVRIHPQFFHSPPQSLAPLSTLSTLFSKPTVSKPGGPQSTTILGQDGPCAVRIPQFARSKCNRQTLVCFVLHSNAPDTRLIDSIRQATDVFPSFPAKIMERKMQIHSMSFYFWPGQNVSTFLSGFVPQVFSLFPSMDSIVAQESSLLCGCCCAVRSEGIRLSLSRLVISNLTHNIGLRGFHFESQIHITLQCSPPSNTLDFCCTLSFTLLVLLG
ncbi:hypothetical protein B0T17DRAFT_535397 [Bombardia bombarda]|uniref:Uncharacterized protein n=1 Tax=Bombardia bombarda TaxID=252184 RepID=A0AA39WV70_9PEZI|nr:hypothetical protein B0T17DRAFT_535397 [Bombardia bombarda]